MPRPREKEKMSQILITDYFAARKSGKRPATNLKENEKLSACSKVLILDSDLHSKKRTQKQSSSSSKLRIEVLEKQTLKAWTAKISGKENNNPNLKNVLDFSKVDILETISSSPSEVILPKEESLEEKEFLKQKDCVISVEENAESSKEQPSSAALESKENLKKAQIVGPLSQEKKIRTKIVNKVLEAEVSTDKVSKTVKSANANSLEIENAEGSQLPEPKKSGGRCEESKNITVANQSQAKFLPLPSEYTFLLRVFTCIDRVALMLYNKGMTITFGKLKPELQNMSTRDVTLDHLAQIKTIYPEAYSYYQKKLRVYPQYEIVLKPNFDFLEKTNKSHSDALKATILLRRERKFYNVLLERVKNEHETFLLGFSTSGSVIPKEKIKLWHPKFDVEKCKPIELADLPIIRNIKLVSPKEVLENVKQCFKVDTNLKNPTEAPETISNPVEKKQDKEVEYYRRLPCIAKIVRNIFLSEKKNVLTFNLVVQKLQYSYSVKLTLDELEIHVRLLCQLVPEWINIFNLGKIDRLKMQKKVPFEKVFKILEASAKKKILLF